MIKNKTGEKMKHIVWFIMCMLVFGADTPKGKQAEILQGIEIGIESITVNEDRSLNVAVYMYNTIPVAGFQANLLPKEMFELDGVTGGIGEEKGFMMSGGKSTFLGFSIKGEMLPASESAYLKDNILCHLNVNVVGELELPMEVSLDPILAGKRGIKLEAQTKPFIWEKLSRD